MSVTAPTYAGGRTRRALRTAALPRAPRSPSLRRALAAADAVALALAFLAGQLLARGAGGLPPPPEALLLAGVAAAVFAGAALLSGLYDRDAERADHGTADDLAAILHLVTLAAWAGIAASWGAGHVAALLPAAIAFWGLGIALVVAGRIAVRSALRGRPEHVQRAVVVGAGRVGQLLAVKLRRHPEFGVEVVGFVDADPFPLAEPVADVPVLGPPDALLDLVEPLSVHRVLVAFSGDRDALTADLVRALREAGVQVDVVPRFFEAAGPNASVHAISGLPLVGLPPLRPSRASQVAKRALDLALAVPALVLLARLFAAIAARIKLDSKGPVFYRHERLGQDGRPFSLLKFRTMHVEHCRGRGYGGEDAERALRELLADPARAEEFGRTFKLRDDPRVTPFGAFLRRTSLDELPQLLNVVRGDLSLVGPRAITVDELDRYGESSATLLSVRPGVSGYWQITDRSDADYDERVRLDLAYLASRSLALDLLIIARTFRALLGRSGAY